MTSVHIGIDVGGTKTHVVAEQGGSELANFIVPTSAWRRCDYDAHDCLRLNELVKARVPLPPESVVVGANGCHTDAKLSRVREIMTAVTGWRIEVVNDGELLGPTCGIDAGISLVVGTGSIAVGRTKEGHIRTSGGWGWLLGDEGSAPGLVREGIRMALAAIERREFSDPLISILTERLRVDDLMEANAQIAREPTASHMGSYCESVFSAVTVGSDIARNVVHSAAQVLSRHVQNVAGVSAHPRCLFIGGSVILNQPFLFQEVLSSVSQLLPELRVVRVSAPPVFGAIRLAAMQNAPTTIA